MDARSSRQRVLFLLSTTTLLLFSILIITLYSNLLVFISNPIVELSQVINFYEQSYPVVQVLPDHLSVTSLKVALASGVFSLAVYSFWVIFPVWFWPNNKRTYIISPITGLIYSSVLNALLGWAAMIYLQVAHVQSAKFDPNYRALYGAYDEGIFDFESWACQVSSYKGTFPRRECRSAVAGRVISILYCITIIGAVAVATWALRREIDVIKRAKYGKRNRKEAGVSDSAVGMDMLRNC